MTANGGVLDEDMVVQDFRHIEIIWQVLVWSEWSPRQATGAGMLFNWHANEGAGNECGEVSNAHPKNPTSIEGRVILKHCDRDRADLNEPDSIGTSDLVVARTNESEGLVVKVFAEHSLVTLGTLNCRDL